MGHKNIPALLKVQKRVRTTSLEVRSSRMVLSGEQEMVRRAGHQGDQSRQWG